MLQLTRISANSRIFLCLAILTIIYPLVIFCAVLTKIYEYFFKRSTLQNDIKDEVAVITGAGHGLGKAIAIELAKKGCRIAVVDINLTDAESTAQFINETFKVQANAYKVDVSNYIEVKQLNEQVTKELGAVTILINNAGILILQNPLNPNWRDVQRMINVNLCAHLWANSIFLPEMKQRRRGYVVAISSASSLFPLAYNSTYTATKFAVSGLMKAIRQELRLEHQTNIHASTVMPTFLLTNQDVADIVERVGFNKLFPSVSGEDAAKVIVEGMLRHEEEIVIPGFLALIYRYLINLPSAWQTNVSRLIGGASMEKFYKSSL